jgi:hypothetical protein
MRFVILFLMCLVAVDSFAQDEIFGRRYQFYEDMDVFPEPQRIEFYQRERVQLDFHITRDNQPVDFSDPDDFAVWEVVTITNPYTAYIVMTATVVNATGGVVRFNVSPEEAMIPEDDYDGFVRLFNRNINTIDDMGVIQRQNVRVRRTPPSEGLNFVGPIWWDRYDPNQLVIDDLVVNTFETLSFTMNGETIFSLPEAPEYELKGASSSYNTSPKYSLVANGTGLVFTIKPIAGLDGITLIESNGTVVISGNATQSVYQFFPQQSHNRARLYVRQGSSPTVISPLDVPTNSTYPALSSDGTNIFWASGIPVADSEFFAGQPPEYYENFQLMTNIPVYNAGTLVPFVGDDIDGFEGGSNVSVSIIGKADPLNPTQTISVLRFDVAGGLGTNVDAILTRENTWTKLNKFNGGLEVANRIRMTGYANNAGLYSSVGIGGSNIVAQGSYSTVIGGRDSSATGIDSIAGGRGAQSRGANSLAMLQGALAGDSHAVAIGFGNLARGSGSAAVGGQNNDVLNAAYAFGGTYNEMKGGNNWAFGNRTYSDYNFVYMFGDGAQNNPLRATRDRSFVLSSFSTNSFIPKYFVGINTNAPLYTNVVLEARGGPVVFESIVFPDGSTFTNANFGSGNASLTSAWAVLYSDGQTNSISLPLGVSNSVLVSQGPNAAPKFVTDGLGGGTITSITADVNYFVVAGSTGPSTVISLNDTAATNLWKASEAYSWGNHSTQGYATGTPLYAFTETDPVWTSEKSLYATGTPLYTFTETNWSLYPAKQNVNIGGFSATNIIEVGFSTNNNTEPAEGSVRWMEDFETVTVGLHGNYKLPLGEASVYPVINQSGGTISNGTLVSAAGTLGNSGKILIEPAFTSSGMPSSRIMGVVPESISDGDSGYVVHFGRIRGLNLTNYSEGALLYADPDNPGGFTTNVPLAPKSKTLVALVINNSENQGAMWVRPTFGSSLANDELVNLGNLSENDVIVYDSVAEAFTNKTLGSLAFTNASFTASLSIESMSGSVTASIQKVFLADTSSSDAFIYLPSAGSTTGGIVSARKMSQENYLYIVAGGSDLVQGVSTVGLTRIGNVIDVFSDGTTNWWLK